MINSSPFNSGSGRQNSAGFTLLEVMVAIVVLSIALTAVIKLFSQAVMLNTTACFYIKTPYKAQEEFALWELKNSLPDKSFFRYINDQLPEEFDITLNQRDLAPELISALPEKSIQTEDDIALMEVSCQVFSKLDPALSYTYKTIRLVRP